MKALVYTGERTLEYQEYPDPIQSESESLIQIKCVGICGSDIHAYLGHDARRPAPLILGHEAAGIVLNGEDEGQKVTVNPLVSCTQCPACLSGKDNLCPHRQIISMPPREGAFAELLSIPNRNLIKVPEKTGFEEASLVEPLACARHAVRLALRALESNGKQAKILIIGGGMIGFGTALTLKDLDFKNIVLAETNNRRREYLAEKEKTAAVFTHEVKDNDFDLVFDCVGFGATRKIASSCVRPGGVIVHIGLGDGKEGLDTRRMTLQEITFIGAYTYTAEDFRQTAQAVFEGRLGKFDWLEVRPLNKGGQAFSELIQGLVSSPKIILKPGL